MLRPLENESFQLGPTYSYIRYKGTDGRRVRFRQLRIDGQSNNMKRDVILVLMMMMYCLSGK